MTDPDALLRAALLDAAERGDGAALDALARLAADPAALAAWVRANDPAAA